MTEERFKAWLGFWQFVVGTVVVGLVSTIISHQIQTREIEIKEQEANARFLSEVLNEEQVNRRRLLAEFFATVTRSDALRARWKDYLAIVTLEYEEKLRHAKALQEKLESGTLTPELANQVQAQVADLRQELSPRITTASRIPARVYIHIREESQRAGAENLASVMRQSELIVPGVERLPTGPNANELRYFKQHEREEAELIAGILRATGLDVRARMVPGYEESTHIRARHYELWLATE